MNKDEFLNHVSSLTNLPKEESEIATLVVLSTLSHRLTEGEASDVYSQLPKGIKDLWSADTWITNYISISRGQILDYSKREELYSLVQNEIDKRSILVDVEKLVEAVLHTLKAQISEGEARDITAQLPKEIKELWERV